MKYDKLFVGGDLSGIQKFLYNITSRKAAVSLKGRSATIVEEMKNIYYAQAKTAVINAGGLISPQDELYCSGGKFFFTAKVCEEKRDSVCRALDECQIQWKEHRGQLGINICYVAFSEENDIFCVEGKYGEPAYEGQTKGPGQLWKVVSAGFAQQKNLRFKEYVLQNYEDFFGSGMDLRVGANYKVCAITGIEFDVTGLAKSDYTIPARDKDAEITVLPSVKKQVEKGENLRNDPKKGFRSFEEYASTDHGEVGDTYLGILRMDVDGLGKRFITGFNSLEEYKLFSEKLCYFFEREVEEDLLLKNDFKKHLNVIYAGGDDLFIVGRWDKVIEFAKLIHEETLRQFSGEGISISGGIAIVKPKYPIAKAAEMAGDAEEAAKQGEKNAINLFGRTISWNGEFEYVEEFKNSFVEYISLYKDYGFNKSILHKIMLYASIVEMNRVRKSHGMSPNYSYTWHICYYLTRFMEKWKGFEKEKNSEKQCVKETLYRFCRKLRDEQLIRDRNLVLMAVAARWAELILKDKEQ